jgi:putative FmdB family regulatory protein
VPTYDYQCRSCGNTTEVIHSMSEEGPTTCEICGGELRRIFHPAGIIFKGSGFYKTDSRASSSASLASSSAQKAGAASDPKAPASTGEASGGSSGGGDTPAASGSSSSSAGSGSAQGD